VHLTCCLVGVVVSFCTVVRARRGRYDCDGAVCVPHIATFMSPAASRAVWGSVYPTRRLVSPPPRSRDVTSSVNAMTLAPPPSLIDVSCRGRCLPHGAVDAVGTSSFTVIQSTLPCPTFSSWTPLESRLIWWSPGCTFWCPTDSVRNPVILLESTGIRRNGTGMAPESSRIRRNGTGMTPESILKDSKAVPEFT
jgi:hypothetical protein